MFTITNEKEVQTVGCVLPNTLVHGDCKTGGSGAGNGSILIEWGKKTVDAIAKHDGMLVILKNT